MQQAVLTRHFLERRAFEIGAALDKPRQSKPALGAGGERSQHAAGTKRAWGHDDASIFVRSRGQRKRGRRRFLDQVAWCIECRLKIMGAIKGEKNVIHTTTIDWDSLLNPPRRNPEDDPIEKRIAEAGKPVSEPPVNRLGDKPSSNGASRE